jgi:hypothetical protein
VLLLAEDGAGTHDAEPGYGLLGHEAMLQHQEEGDEGARPAQARAAVHRDHALGGVEDAEKAGHELAGRRSAVLEEEVVVLEAGAEE